MKIDTFLTKEMCPIVEYRNGEQAIKMDICYFTKTYVN